MEEVAKTIGVPALVVTGGLSLISLLARMLWTERKREFLERLKEKDDQIAELKRELSKTSATLLEVLAKQ